MRKSLLSMGLVAFLAWGCQTENSDILRSEDAKSTTANARVAGARIIPGKYIIVFKSDRALTGLGAQMKGKAIGIMKRYGGSESQIEHVYSTAIQGFSAFLSPGLYDKIAQDVDVAYVESDFEVTLAQKKPGGGTTTQPAQTIPWGITRVGGAGNGTGKNAWVIDTGIQTNHPDLLVNASRGFSAFTSGKDAGVNDGNGHGTHVAGTIAALNNTIGVVGVAAGATVIPVKVLGATGSGSNAGVIAGVDFVAANGQVGDVANMSLGGGVSTALDVAVSNAAAKGILFVLAAGNSSADANTSSPARVNGANIYTISAHDVNNVFASFSNFGNPPVDFCAPGVAVNSTWIGSAYRSISGTSMAAPHVAGILLLGPVNSRGTVTGDRDSNPDLMATR